ncbi:hypothetical protein EXIGLDRAFT_775745 [Exidia glandulosa HHB12029]|uniref:Uncharacterized protein n=1 Tax=Exidia glandulosa HHB12029 TaxID=1314781 RepID=A0A165DSE3_EXIGL|nr:hypothetical protein EXIGLDRAFT_775745 [Exidia glandulosa HHB12029]
MKPSLLASASTDSLPDLIPFDQSLADEMESRMASPRRVPYRPMSHPYLIRMGQVCSFDHALPIPPNANPFAHNPRVASYIQARDTGFTAALDDFSAFVKRKPKPAPERTRARL